MTHTKETNAGQRLCAQRVSYHALASLHIRQIHEEGRGGEEAGLRFDPSAPLTDRFIMANCALYPPEEERGDQDGILQPRHELADCGDRARGRCGWLWGLPLVGKPVTVALPTDSDQEDGPRVELES